MGPPGENARVLRTNVPHAVSFLRRRRGWRQEDLGARAGVSRETVSRLERGSFEGLSVAAIDRIAEVLEASLSLDLRWQGEQLDRLMDASHAALQQLVAQLLTTAGWVVRVEVSFSHYGDRGRCDILAFHPATRILLIVEVKSALGDVQDTLGRLDVKVRLGPVLAREMGWPAPVAVVPLLVLAEGRTPRRVIARHAALFARFALRGRASLAWIRQPHRETTGLLLLQLMPDSHGATIRRGARVRKPSPSHRA